MYLSTMRMFRLYIFVVCFYCEMHLSFLFVMLNDIGNMFTVLLRVSACSLFSFGCNLEQGNNLMFSLAVIWIFFIIIMVFFNIFNWYATSEQSMSALTTYIL